MDTATNNGMFSSMQFYLYCKSITKCYLKGLSKPSVILYLPYKSIFTHWYQYEKTNR